MELQLCNMKSNHEIIQSSYTTVPLDHIRVRRSRSLNLPIKNSPNLHHPCWTHRWCYSTPGEKDLMKQNDDLVIPHLPNSGDFEEGSRNLSLSTSFSKCCSPIVYSDICEYYVAPGIRTGYPRIWVCFCFYKIVFLSNLEKKLIVTDFW